MVPPPTFLTGTWSLGVRWGEAAGMERHYVKVTDSLRGVVLTYITVKQSNSAAGPRDTFLLGKSTEYWKSATQTSPLWLGFSTL
jgi:hypothetical protein